MTSASQAGHERLFFGPFVLSPRERLLTRDGVPVEIGGRSFDLLVVLTEQPGRVLSKRELLKRVWSDVVVEDGSVRFHMAGLRKLLGDGADGARYIATQVGVGYAFVAPVVREVRSESTEVNESSLHPRIDRPALAGPNNLPPPLAHLIGREHDIELLEARIATTQLFTIVGAGGVGKTSVALVIGHRLAASFRNRLAFVDLAMLENPSLVPSMVAGAMGLQVQSDDPLAVILGHLGSAPFLLILDNCEHVIEPAARLVERLLGSAPHVRVLATSREPLRIRGENVHRLDALGFPEAPAGLLRHELLAFPAVQLFCERAGAADSTLSIDDESLRLIGEICGRLGGMALPIELAAVRAATHGIAATAKQLGERFSLAWPGRRTALPRQQTLQATLDWSYDLLTAVEQQVLARLSVFVGPFSLDAALAVIAGEDISGDQVVEAVEALAAKSLIAPSRVRDAGTYRLLEMTRAHARQKLLALGAAPFNAVARRHAAFFLSELEAAAEQGELDGDDRQLRQQLGNIRSALAWSFGATGDSRLAVRLAAASAPVFLTFSHLIECRTWCEHAVDVFDDMHRGAAIELELQGALGIALMFTRGNSDSAGGALTRALTIATALDDRWNQLRMLGRLHIFHERIGEYAVAMGYARRAVTIAEELGKDEAIGLAYSLSGISHHLAGDQARARHELEISLARSPQSVRSRTIHYGFDHRNRSMIALARVLWLAGDATQAEEMARQAVRTASRLDHPVTQCIALIWSLAVHSWMEDVDAARADLDAFSHCAESNALAPYVVAAAGFRGELALLEGRPGGTIELLEDSLVRLRAARYELLTTPFSIALARALLIDNRVREADQLIDNTIGRCDANGERFAMPELLRTKAAVLRLQGRTDAAIDLLKQAAALATEQSALAWKIRTAVDLVQLLQISNRSAEGADLLASTLKEAEAAQAYQAFAALQQLSISSPAPAKAVRRYTVPSE
jgi:predicted ATPase/DNA-binding winged helix-turn-helix (wHTH) protein